MFVYVSLNTIHNGHRVRVILAPRWSLLNVVCCLVPQLLWLIHLFMHTCWTALDKPKDALRDAPQWWQKSSSSLHIQSVSMHTGNTWGEFPTTVSVVLSGPLLPAFLGPPQNKRHLVHSFTTSRFKSPSFMVHH